MAKRTLQWQMFLCLALTFAIVAGLLAQPVLAQTRRGAARGALGGALIGGLVGGGRGAAIGALVGAGTGAAISRNGWQAHGRYYWWYGDCYYRGYRGRWYRVSPQNCW